MNKRTILAVLIIALIAALAFTACSKDGADQAVPKEKDVDIADLLERANEALDEADYDEAVVLFQEVLDEKKDAVDAVYGITKAYIGMQKYAKAEKVLRAALEDAEAEADYWDLLIDVYSAAQEGDQAIADLRAEAFEATALTKYQGHAALQNDFKVAAQADDDGDDKADDASDDQQSQDAAKADDDAAKEDEKVAQSTTDNEREADDAPLPDEEMVVTFADPVFERAVREIYQLPDGAIKWRDIGYRKRLVLGEFDDENYDYINCVELDGPIETLADLKWFINLKELLIERKNDDYRTSAINVDTGYLRMLNRVEVLKLDHVNASGSISDIETMTNLKTLSLGYTGLYEKLSIISTLKSLEHLNISSGYSGDIADLAGLNLQTVKLTSDDISGDIGAFANMAALHEIDLVGENYTGSLASLSGLSDLQVLRIRDVFYGGDNELMASGNLSDLASLAQLRKLSLKGNYFSGDISALASCSALESVALSGASFTGELSAFNVLTKLRTLVLKGRAYGENSAIGGDIAALANSSQLEDIVIYSPNVVGDISSLQSLAKLRTLDIDSYDYESPCQVTADIGVLSNFPELKRVSLSGDDVHGDIAILGSLQHLEDLSLLYTKISGDIAALKDIPSLQRIELSRTAVSGDIAAFGNLPALRSLQFGGTAISGDIAALGNLLELTYLSLDDTVVSGDISALNNCTQLYDLDVSGTMISGDIASLNNLTELSYFSTSDTSLTGTLTLADGTVFTAGE